MNKYFKQKIGKNHPRFGCSKYKHILKINRKKPYRCEVIKILIMMHIIEKSLHRHI